MAHLSAAVYLRALKQGLQLLPYIKSHRIFRQCQFNRQFHISRAQYSDSADPESFKGQGLPRKLHKRVLTPEDEARDQELLEMVSKGSVEQDSFGNRSRYRAISNDSYKNKNRNPFFMENGRNSRKTFEYENENQTDQLKERSNYPVESNNGGHFDENNKHKEGSFERKGRLDGNYVEGRQGRFDREYGGRKGGFERNEGRSYEHREGRFDRNGGRRNEHREGRFDRNEGRSYEHRDGRFDRNEGSSYEHREGRFDRNGGRSSENKEGRFDRNYGGREDRFDRNEGRFDRNEGRFDRRYEHREGRFDRRYGGREDKFDRNYGHSSVGIDRNEGRFDRSYERRERRFERPDDHREGKFDRNGRQWMDGNDKYGINQKDHYGKRQGHNSGNSKVNKIFSHTNVEMKFTDETLSGNSFYKEPKFERNERDRRPPYNKYEMGNDRDRGPSYKRDQHRKESKPIKESVAISEFDEDYESNEDFQVRDFDEFSNPAVIRLRRRTRNYQRDGAYKQVRYDQARSSKEIEKDEPTSDVEADIDYFNRNELYAEEEKEKSIKRSQSYPHDVENKRKWKKSYGSLSDKKYDRRSDEDFDEEKPHRRLSAEGRKNVPVWYALQMKKLAKKGQIKEAVDVLEIWMLERDRVQPDHYTFSVLINILAKAGLTDKAFKIFNKMKKMGFYSNAYVYSALFNACANSPWKDDGLQRAVKLRATMKEKDWIPNYKTSTAMIKAFGKCDDLKTCFEIMDDICVRYPTELDSSCFSTLLSVCIPNQQNGFKLALRVWQKMQDMGIRPTGDVYNFMLKAVRDSHFDYQIPEADKSDTFIEESNSPFTFITNSGENSLVPSENLPNLLSERYTDIDELLSTIDFTKRANKLALFGGADTVLQHMKSNQVKTDIRIFSLLLDCSEHTLVAEDKLLELMKEQNVKPDQEFCNSLIRRRALRCDNDNARAVLQLMTDNYLQPNMETFTNLALSCHQANDGLQLLKDIEDLDSEPTLEVISNLVRTSGLNFFYKNQLLIKMEKLDLKPDKALIINIEKQIEKGKQLIIKLENESFKGEKYSNLQDLQTGFEHFMKHYKGWLHRTDIEEPQHPYHIIRKNQSRN